MSVTRYNFEVASQIKITDQIVYVEARPSKNGKYVRYSDYAALLASHNALRDAVAWERECNDASESVYDEDGAKYDGEVEFENILSAARAEVDRLLEEGKK